MSNESIFGRSLAPLKHLPGITRLKRIQDYTITGIIKDYKDYILGCTWDYESANSLVSLLCAGRLNVF